MAHLDARHALSPQFTPSANASIALFSRTHIANESAIGSPVIFLFFIFFCFRKFVMICDL